MKVFQKIRFNYLLAVFAAFAMAAACSKGEKNGPRITSYTNLYRIGLAIRQFELTNGALPVNLSEIVPQYIPLDELGVFYVTNTLVSNQELPQNWQADPNLIDANCSYYYVGTNNVHGVIAYERMNLWKSTAANAGKLAVLFSDYHVEYVAIVKVQELIGLPQSATTLPELLNLSSASLPLIPIAQLNLLCAHGLGQTVETLLNRG